MTKTWWSGARMPGTLLAASLLAAGVGACRSESAVDSSATESVDGAERPAAAASDDPVSAYLAFEARVQRPQADEPLEPGDIAEGLRHLAGVVGTLDQSSPELATDLRAAAEHVLLNPASTDVAAVVKEALAGVAMVLETGPAGAAVVKAAAGIGADAPITGQSLALRRYFQEAAAALAARAAAAGPEDPDR